MEAMELRADEREHKRILKKVRHASRQRVMHEMAVPSRARLAFVPTWSGKKGVEGWAKTIALQNEWRVMPQHDVDDLMQEAWHIFNRCCDAYPHVFNQQHFLALFTRAFTNYINNQATKRTRRRTVSNHFDENAHELHAADDTGLAEAAENLLRHEAPPPVAHIIRRMLDSDIQPRPMRRGKVRETTNEFLCRICKLDPSRFNVRQLLERYLAGEQIYV